MKKYKIGQRVKCGGSKGVIMTITKIEGSKMILKSENCTFYYQKGDCKLIPIKEYEQLKLF